MRIALQIEYEGSEFSGWQAQSGLHTVQACVEKAVSVIAAEPVNIFCAGRTDSGVHARGQVVHFDTTANRQMRAWTYGMNANLPPSICVRLAREVDEHFHARFSARARRYRYIIYNTHLRPAILTSRATWHYAPLDADKMQAAANFLLGEQDFSSFRSSRCESKSAVRNVHEVKVTREGDFIIFEVEANAFLHHMVRNFVGVLLEVGEGKYPPAKMLEILNAKDRRSAAITAPPNGLYFMQVRYPEHYEWPEVSDRLVLF